jgi:hypothetical protein
MGYEYGITVFYSTYLTPLRKFSSREKCYESIGKVSGKLQLKIEILIM